MSNQVAIDILKATLQETQTLVRGLERDHGWSEPRDFFGMLCQYGYVGFVEPDGRLNAGTWLRPSHRTMTPMTQDELSRSLGIVVCLHGGRLPGNIPAVIRSSGTTEYSRAAYVSSDEYPHLVLTDADFYTPMDHAIILLHEARHVRHRLGMRFAGLSPLEADDVHETQCWAFALRILDCIGGAHWSMAVEREMEWLVERLDVRLLSPSAPYFAMSNQYHPALEFLFGSALHDRARQTRNLLVSFAARLRLAKERECSVDETLHNTVTAYYRWAHGMV